MSSTAIHNIYQSDGRDQAIDEIARVLKPGGQPLIHDIRHLSQYAKRLRTAGCRVNLIRSASSWYWRLVSLGNLAPGTLVGTKASVAKQI